MWFYSKNSVRCLISANNLSENTQHVIDQASPLKKIFELCFLIMFFDVNCLCVSPMH